MCLRSIQKQLEVVQAREQELQREKDALRDRYEAEVRKLNEESVYLRGLLSETTLELESRFHGDAVPERPPPSPPPSPERRESKETRGRSRAQPGQSQVAWGRDERKSESSEVVRGGSWSTSQHAEERISVNELSDIMEALSGEASSRREEPRQARRRFATNEQVRRSTSSDETGDDEHIEHSRGLGSSYAQAQGRTQVRSSSGGGGARPVATLTARLLQESEADGSDSGDERGTGARRASSSSGPRSSSSTSRRPTQSQLGGGRLLRSPDSEHSSSNSDTLSVENRLKGLIQAALRED